MDETGRERLQATSPRRIPAWLRWLPAVLFPALTSLPGNAPAPQLPRAIPGGDTEILLLGTAGGPRPGGARSEPATLLVVDGREYLVDCGSGTVRQLLRAGVRAETIGTLFITHHHPDHDLGLADVLAADLLNRGVPGAARRFEVYGPPQTGALVDAALRYVAIPYGAFAAEPSALSPAPPRDVVGDAVTAHDLDRAGLVYADDRIRVYAAENSHYALMPAAERQTRGSYSYRIETPHGVVVFTGDTGPSDAVTRLARGADVLVAEAEDPGEAAAQVHRQALREHWPAARARTVLAHLTQEHLGLRQLGRMAAAARVRAVVLSHTSPSDPAAWVAEVGRAYAGPVFAGADLDRYCLGLLRGAGGGPLARCRAPAAPR